MVIHVEIYLAAKQLHREGLESFSASHLKKKIAEMFDDRRAGIASNISSDCCASAPKNYTTVYNYLVRLEQGMYRLFKDGDIAHSSRIGAATRPKIEDVPPEYWPLWADEDNEAEIQFNGFKDEHFSLFETEQKTYRQGDPIKEKFQGKWVEWKQYVQMVVNHTSNKFNYATEQWQNSGFLNNNYFWSRLKEKGRDNFATCMSLMIDKDKLIVSLGMHRKLESSGKAQDNKSQFNTWIDQLAENSIPREHWDNYFIWVSNDNKYSLTQYFSDPANHKSLLLQTINVGKNEDAYIKFGRIYNKEEAIELGFDIIIDVSKNIENIYPFYRSIMQKSLDNMFLIGSSTDLNDNFPEYQEFIKSKGAMMYWWSYIIREEYLTHLKKNLPISLYIYGVTPGGKRAITHCLTVSEFITVPGRDGIESPYPDLTMEHERGIKRLGDSQSKIFKTWMKVIKIDELPKPIGIDEFVHYDTQGFINPSIMVNSFVYARKISADELAKRLANCINVTLENFSLHASESRPLEEVIREQKGFSFDLSLNYEFTSGIKITRLSGSRYKNKNSLLLHISLSSQEQNWQQKIRDAGYDEWLKNGVNKDADIKFEDEHSISNDLNADHVKLADINLDNFSEASFIEPLEEIFKVLGNENILPTIKPNIKEILATRHIEEMLYAIANSDYVFPEELVINLHNCLNALEEKHFLILTGVSGTGKTKFPQIYVNALYGLPPGDRNNPFFALIPVQPQWSDRTGLLGYFNPITGRYHRPLFLEYLLKAMNDPEHSYFVCLDEMNLAVVEHYFADILSAMESNQKIQLHSNETAIDGVPPFVDIPANLYVVGTVNIDETTHQFSTKVLDRAYTIEFNEVDLETFLDNYLKRPEVAGAIDSIKSVGELCIKINNVLNKHNMHFGYRTYKEILAYMLFNNMGVRPLPFEYAMDNMVMQKILPRLRGDERIEGMLKKLIKLVEDNIETDQYKTQSLQRLQEMLSELEQFGTCQFWR